MERKFHQAGYKVRRLGGGVYLVQCLYNGSAIVSQAYINRVTRGSQNFYTMIGHPYYRTLRDAIFAIVA